VETAVCAWSEPGPVLDRAPWDLVLAADVLYGQRGIDELTPLLPRLVEGGEVWVADPERPLAPAFLAAARERWAQVETLPTRQHDVRIHRLAGPRLPR
jgi:predicted nicotinamide N-methyase